MDHPQAVIEKAQRLEQLSYSCVLKRGKPLSRPVPRSSCTSRKRISPGYKPSARQEGGNGKP